MKVALPPGMRLATPQDGVALAELVNFAGEGLPLYLWKSLAGPDEDPWTIGAARQARQAEAGTVVVVEQGASVVAAMIGHPLGEQPPADASMPAMLRPLHELERKVPGTWYLNVLATYPRARGRGLGSRLLEVAEADAAASGLSGVSIICADANVGAHRLYQRLGYHEVARAPMVKNGWESASQAWILLVKEV